MDVNSIKMRKETDKKILRKWFRCEAEGVILTNFFPLLTFPNPLTLGPTRPDEIGRAGGQVSKTIVRFPPGRTKQRIDLNNHAPPAPRGATPVQIRRLTYISIPRRNTTTLTFTEEHIPFREGYGTRLPQNDGPFLDLHLANVSCGRPLRQPVPRPRRFARCKRHEGTTKFDALRYTAPT